MSIEAHRIGELIREHYSYMSFEERCEKFLLTPVGLQAILDGADWSPEHCIIQLKEDR